MRRKRLKHIANTLCHIFCGWRLINSFTRLQDLGSGILSINALTGSCVYNDVEIEPLSIAGELQDFVRRECDAHSIPIENIEQAQLVAELTLSKIPSNRMVTYTFYAGGEVKSRQFYQLRINCSSFVSTATAEYESTYSDIEEWPEGLVVPPSTGKDANEKEVTDWPITPTENEVQEEPIASKSEREYIGQSIKKGFVTGMRVKFGDLEDGDKFRDKTGAILSKFPYSVLPVNIATNAINEADEDRCYYFLQDEIVEFIEAASGPFPYYVFDTIR